MAPGLTVAGFRLPFRHFDNADRLLEAMTRSAETVPVDGESPSFFVFPGLMPMGLLPTDFLLDPEGLAGRLEAEGGALAGAYNDVGKRLAETLEAYVLPGSVLVPSAEGYRHTAAIFGPDGTERGRQEQVYARRDEADLEVGLTAQPVPVGDFHVGILLGADPWVPEVSRVLALEGADLLVALLARPSPYGAEEAMAGLWQEVQQNQVFGLEVGMSGPLFGTLADGKLAFMAPCEVTPDGSGFLGGAGYRVADGWRTAVLETSVLRRARRAYPLMRHLNPSLYRRYFPIVEGGPRP